MKRIEVVVFIGLLLCRVLYAVVRDVSVSCMMVYEEGGAPAVFSSPECRHWESSKNSTKNCQFATIQGHREYQEDRVTCDLDMKLPFSDEGVTEDISVGIAAIFDGHGGKEASEMASTKLSDYFFLNVVFTAYNRALPSNKENHKIHPMKSPTPQRIPLLTDHHSLRQILEEALLRTIHDIDSEFSKEAFDKGYISGSTATIVILFKGEFLVANVGDSKALLCSQKVLSQHDPKGASLGEIYAEELTKDHHPDREDENARIEAAGGFVSKSRVPRVNGILAVSRAIGDVYLKRYGVTAEAEITGWRDFTAENKYLIVASDGVFETLTTQNVCEIIHDKVSSSSSEHVTKFSLPESIISHAFRTGSADNLSAIVISDLCNCTEERCVGREN